MGTQAFQDVLNGKWSKAESIALWDGKAGERIAKILLEELP
jgi:hypothetical protein